MAKPPQAPGVILGRDRQTGEPVAIGEIESRSATMIQGASGMGKSALEINILAQAIEQGHGAFFLDPAADAIEALVQRMSADEASPDQLRDWLFLLDVENKRYSYGIHLTACSDVASLTARTATYTRAYNVFYKLWEDSWGPWLQLILQNTLWAFIENQDYTLAEAPMFLHPHPRNSAFRNHILANIKYSPAVVDFWKYEFFQRRTRDQQERVDAALTRLSTLLTHPYVRHIIGQHKTTIDFAQILEQQQVVLVKLSANLAPDIKKFIGTLWMSELLHAVRNRPEGKRGHVVICVDELQNFASSEDFTTLVTEGRKFGTAAVYALVERYGMLSDNQRLQGATLAAANKVLFQLSVKDAQELAPEFAEKAPETKTIVGGELIISPHPAEDIWDRGHPDETIMLIRNKYFWLVDLLRRNPNEKYFVFNPADHIKLPYGNNPGKLHESLFDDWDMYRSSNEMVKLGLSLLNTYYYGWMQQKYTLGASVSGEELALVLQIIECLGGVFGFRPVMEPYVPDERRLHLFHTINEALNQVHEEERRKKIQRLRDEIQYLKDHGVKEERWGSVSSGASDSTGPGATGGSSSRSYSHSTPILRYVGGTQEDFQKQEGHLKDLWNQIRTLEESKPSEIASIPGTLLHPRHAKEIRSMAIRAGMSMRDVEDLIGWEVRPLGGYEKTALTAFIKTMLDASVLEQKDPGERKALFNNALQEYKKAAYVLPLVSEFGQNFMNNPSQRVIDYWEKVDERITWQATEMNFFIMLCLRIGVNTLAASPIKVQSGHYDEAPKREITQGEMIDIMAQELANLPRFTAFAKVIEERDGVQTVRKCKIATRPLPLIPARPLTSAMVEQHTIAAGLCVPRRRIEQELRARQDQWLRRPDRRKPSPRPQAPPPSSEPPPTSEPPPAAA